MNHILIQKPVLVLNHKYLYLIVNRQTNTINKEERCCFCLCRLAAALLWNVLLQSSDSPSLTFVAERPRWKPHKIKKLSGCLFVPINRVCPPGVTLLGMTLHYASVFPSIAARPSKSQPDVLGRRGEGWRRRADVRLCRPPWPCPPASPALRPWSSPAAAASFPETEPCLCGALFHSDLNKQDRREGKVKVLFCPLMQQAFVVSRFRFSDSRLIFRAQNRPWDEMWGLCPLMLHCWSSLKNNFCCEISTLYMTMRACG